jgi:sporulation protein YlmC with PRC-barrel domain
MTFRRLALALALLSAPVDADDFEELVPTDVDSDTAELSLPLSRPGTKGVLSDLLVRHDGSIDVAVTKNADSERYVPWGIVRLVLADVGAAGEEHGFAEENQEPLWIPAPTARLAPMDRAGRRDAEAPFSLNTLAGSAVVGPLGETIGVVRGWLVSWERGRVLALAVDVGAFLGTESRTVAVPWTWLRTPVDTSSNLTVTGEADLNWLRWANEVVFERARE